MKKNYIIGFLLIGLFMAGQAFAHTPLCSCWDNGDSTITCEGGFSDGSSAAGVIMRVTDSDGKLLIDGKMNEDSEFTFKKPSVPYSVEFDAGEGHRIITKGEDILE